MQVKPVYITDYLLIYRPKPIYIVIVPVINVLKKEILLNRMTETHKRNMTVDNEMQWPL